MGTLISNTCWPVRFPMKWLQIFVIALLLGVCWRLVMPRPQIQGLITVYIQYEGDAEFQRTAAWVYFADSPEQMRDDKKTFITATEPGKRSQNAKDLVKFMVVPVNTKKEKQGEAVRFVVTWPEHERDEVPLRIKRSYRRPKH